MEHYIAKFNQAQTKVPLGTYTHFKTGESYIVTGYTFDALNDYDVLISYHSPKYTAVTFSRNISSFTEMLLWPDGVLRQRFAPA